MSELSDEERQVQNLEQSPLAIRAGGAYYQVLDELVWGPFVLVFGLGVAAVLGGIAFLLPTWVAQPVFDVALGWLLFFYGDTGILPVGSVIGWLVVAVVAFKVYLRVFVRVLS